MIDNFKVIDKFLQFEDGTFYKFELLVRNTDGNNILYQDGYSATNKNILVKSWYVDNKDYYEKIKHEMITMSELTGARLYVTLDRKDNVKLVQSLIHAFTDTLCGIVKGQKPSIKNISKTFASETSKVENSSKPTKTLMFDVDTKDADILKTIKEYIFYKVHNYPFILETKKGYHVFCYRKFDHSDWLDMSSVIRFKSVKFEDATAERDYITSFKSRLKQLVSVKENELGLVYHPEKEIGNE